MVVVLVLVLVASVGGVFLGEAKARPADSWKHADLLDLVIH